MMEWIIVAIGMAGTILNIYKNRLCFVLWSICNVGLFTINLKNNNYPQAIYFLFCLGTTIWGLFKWSHK